MHNILLLFNATCMRKDQVSQSEEMTDPNILKEQQQYIPSVNIRGEVLLIMFTVMHEKLSKRL